MGLRTAMLTEAEEAPDSFPAEIEYDVAACVAVGVPEIAPVSESSLMPAGREATVNDETMPLYSGKDGVIGVPGAKT